MTVMLEIYQRYTPKPTNTYGTKEWRVNDLAGLPQGPN